MASLSSEEILPKPLSAAVLDFKETSPDLAGLGASVSALLQVQLAVHSDAILVERAELNAILAEHELTLSEAVTPDQAAQVAQLTGAEVLISGRVFSMGKRVHLVVKVISATNSRVFGSTASYDDGKPIDPAIEQLGKDVAKVLREKSADLRGGPSLEERVIAKVKSALEKHPVARIHVHIPEEILKTQVPDPAAQTEIARTFQQAGWTPVDAETNADLMIRGEAFAETGIRRGNLWFTRARLEFTVRDAKGRILKTDRVVCGNVDLAQAVAAKGSLQKAGLIAAESAAQAWSVSREIAD